MATATTLQLMDSVAGDGTTSLGITASNRRQVETFIAAAPIVAGDLVCIAIGKIAAANPGVPVAKGWSEAAIADAVLYISKADSAQPKGVAAIGFAIDTAAAGDQVRVTVAGIHAEGNIEAGVVQGDRLKVTNVAGEADTWGAADTVPCIGYALSNYSASALSPVFVIKQF